MWEGRGLTQGLHNPVRALEQGAGMEGGMGRGLHTWQSLCR